MQLMYLLSDTIPEGEREAYADIAISALDLLTLYDRLVDAIGWFARKSLHGKPERETADLTFDAFRRARESEIGGLFVRLADHLQVPGERTEFTSVYARVNATRNHIAHASDMVADTRAGKAGIAITYYWGHRKRLGSLDGKSWVSKGLLAKRYREAEWMLLHVAWSRAHLGISPDEYTPPEGAPKVSPPTKP